MEATNNLSDVFIIGSSGSGNVYKTELLTEETIVVKKIPRKDNPYMDKCFARKVKTPGRIRHWNFVKLLEYCSNSGERRNLCLSEFMEMEVCGLSLTEHTTSKH